MSEYSSVQKPILKYAQELGWSLVPRTEADAFRGFKQEGISKDRAVGSSLFFPDLLYAKVKQFNPKYTDSKDNLIRQLSVLQNNIKGNRGFFEYLKGNKTFFCKGENRELNLKLIDFENISNNTFQVTEEYYFSNGRYGNREDIVFLINGIPIVAVECKDADKEEAIDIGIDQIRRYHRETPEMLIPEQIFTVTEALGFFYGVTWNTTRRTIFEWKHEEVGKLENKIKTFFDQKKVLSYIKEYIIFQEKDEELNKYILRQHQTEAVEAVVGRALDKTKRRGLVWHTQGSGKTFSMIKSAEILFKASETNKPTILLLIDRNELEDQLMRNLVSLGITHSVIAESINKLNELLASDFRGIIVSMIHKFHGMREKINLRENIYVLVDEAHRTTQGDLGNYLMAGIPNATFIGFSGTPIDKTAYGKGTFKTFGIDDPKGYLHKYSIADSIKDGTTLPIFYSLAPNELLVPKEILEKEFLKLAEAEGVNDIEELNKILDKAINTKNFLKGTKRIDTVAQFVAKHFKETVEPMGYKAFMVGVDREACALYKKALDKYLPAEYSQVVYTSAHNDDAHLKEYYISSDDEKAVRKSFAKQDKQPKILIVTEKLLTGYDAPVLYAMYLDKPMRDHALLQAVARVNRPYENEDKNMKKPHGFILDFIGIFDKLEKALAFDSKEVSAVVRHIDLLKRQFEEKMKKDAPKYIKLSGRPITDKDIDSLIEHFRDKSKRKEFFKVYKEIEALYEIISPDAFLHPFISDYRHLADIYFRVRNAFAKRVTADREFLRKTNELVRDYVSGDNIQGGFDFFEINEEGLKRIQEINKPGNVKVINLVKSIQKYVEEHSGDLSLIPLSARAEAVKAKYDERQENTKDALIELTAIFENELKAQQEKKAKGFDGLAAFIYSTVLDKKLPDADKTAKKIRETFDQHTYWQGSESVARELRLALYGVVGEIEKDEDKVADFINNLFELLEKSKDI